MSPMLRLIIHLSFHRLTRDFWLRCASPGGAVAGWFQGGVAGGRRAGGRLP